MAGVDLEALSLVSAWCCCCGLLGLVLFGGWRDHDR